MSAFCPTRLGGLSAIVATVRITHTYTPTSDSYKQMPPKLSSCQTVEDSTRRKRFGSETSIVKILTRYRDVKPRQFNYSGADD